ICLHSVMAALPTVAISEDAKRELYLPLKIERVRFYATPSSRLFAHAQLREFGPSEIKADIELLDETGNLLVEVQGLVCRPAGHHEQGVRGALYEYQWKLAPRAAPLCARDSHHLPAPE